MASADFLAAFMTYLQEYKGISDVQEIDRETRKLLHCHELVINH